MCFFLITEVSDSITMVLGVGKWKVKMGQLGEVRGQGCLYVTGLPLMALYP